LPIKKGLTFPTLLKISMKRFFIIIALAILLPISPALASDIYSRSPSTDNFIGDLTIHFEPDNAAQYCGATATRFWFSIQSNPGDALYSQGYDTSETSVDAVVSLPAGDYSGIGVQYGLSDYSGCDGYQLEGLSDDQTIFTVDSADALSRTGLTNVIIQAKSDTSDIASHAMTYVLSFVGLLIAGGLAWRFFKRHVGMPIDKGYWHHDTPDGASAKIRGSGGKTPWGDAS